MAGYGDQGGVGGQQDPNYGGQQGGGQQQPVDQDGLKQQYFQSVDQDGSLNDEQKQQRKHKIERDIAAGVITAGLGYEAYSHHEKKKAEEAQGGGGGGSVFGL